MIDITALDHELETVELKLVDRPNVIDRIDIDQDKIKELAESIEAQGLLQHPIFRPREGRYEVVAGDRRVLALKMLERKTVKAVIVEMTDMEAAEARGTENLQRENLTVIEEAKIYYNLHINYKLTIPQIAKRMSTTAGTVKRRLDLLKMHSSLQDAMQKKQISYGVAEALWPIRDEDALSYYLGFATEHGVTVAVARQWCSDWKASQRRVEGTGGDAMDEIEPPISRPVYLACDLCQQPELVEDLRLVRVCRDCMAEITANIAVKRTERR